MVKASKPRHSRTTRKPVTIDLEPDAVSDTKETGGKTGTKTTAAKTTAAKTSRTKATGPAIKKTTTARKPAASSRADESRSEQAPKTQAKADTAKAAEGESPAKASADAPKPSAAPAVDTGQPERQGSGLRPFAVGLVAALAAVVLVVGLQWGGVLPAPGSGSDGSAVLSEDLDALKRTVAALQNDVTAATGDVGQALESRIEALESATGSSVGSDAVEQRFQALEGKVTALSSQAGDTNDASNGEALAGINDKLAAIEQAQSSQQTALQGVEGTVADLGRKIAADETGRDQSIKALESRLSAIEGILDEPRQDIKVARALAAASLKAAIDRGGSFMAELEAFASVDGNSQALDQLRTLAAAGVPSRATLLRRFPAAANAMIDAGGGGDASGGVWGHLLSSATSLVRVRPVGDVAGDSVEAIVARMETRLKNGDLQGAVDEWNTLPQASQNASGAYVKDLKARIEAEKLVSGTLTAALPSTTSAGDSASGAAAPGNGAGATQAGEQN